MAPVPSKKNRPRPGTCPPWLLALLPKPPVGGGGSGWPLLAARIDASTFTILAFSTCTLYVPLRNALVQPLAASDRRGCATSRPQSNRPVPIHVFEIRIIPYS